MAIPLFRRTPMTQQLATRMTSYGRIKEFRPEEETIESYLEHIELFFTANDIADGKKVLVFLSVIGSKTYVILRNLLAPAEPSDKEFATLCTELKNCHCQTFPFPSSVPRTRRDCFRVFSRVTQTSNSLFLWRVP